MPAALIHNTWVAAYRKKGRYQITTIKSSERNKNTAVLYRRIGSTTYLVKVHFSDTGQETMNDKILHLIQHEGVTNAAACGMMDVPQMTQPLERSSL